MAIRAKLKLKSRLSPYRGLSAVALVNSGFKGYSPRYSFPTGWLES